MRPAWRDILFGAVFLAPPFLKKVLLRLGGAEIAPTARLGWFSTVRGRRIVLGEHSSIRPLTLVRCDGDVRLGRYAEVSSFVLVYGAAGFSLGEHSYVGPQCLINADDDVRIGDRSALGPRCMVFTHGSFLPYTEGYPVRLAGVTVGDRTWIAAGVFLHPGVRVADDVLINSRAVVSGDIPAGMVAEGSPARPLFPIARLRRRMTPARVDEAMRHVLARFADMVLRRRLEADVVAEGPDVLQVSYAGRSYRVQYVPASAPPALQSDERTVLIVLSNNPTCRVPESATRTVLVDLVSGRFPPLRDTVASELVDFLRRYYGVKLELRSNAAVRAEPAGATVPVSK